MKTLYVYADFDWLDEPMLVGELGYESLRGSDSYSFKYDNDWLRQYGSLFRQKMTVVFPKTYIIVIVP